MGDLKRIVDEDRRLVFLRLLAADNDYTGNNFVLREALTVMGHGVSLDKVETDGAWLAEQGLVTVARPGSGLSVYTLTARGHDVARGCAVVPGVKRPEPGLDY